MKKSSFLESISSLIVIFLLLAAIAAQQGKLFGIDFLNIIGEEKKIEQPIQNKQFDDVLLKKAGFSEISKEEEIKKGIWYLYNSKNKVTGKVIVSSEFAHDIIGYAGPIPLYIFIDKDNKICFIELLPNSETPGFMNAVTEKGIIAQWIGKDVKLLADFKADVLSGATLSSNAINQSVTLSFAAFNEENNKNIVQTNWWQPKTILALLVILTGIYVAFFKAKNKKLRVIQFVLNTVVLGFWCGQFLSVSIFIGFLTNGLNFTTNIVLIVMLLLAIGIPMFTSKKSYYCNFICPFGSIQELAGKIPVKKIQLSEKAHTILSNCRKIITMLLFFVLWLGVSSDIVNYEPFSAFIFQNASWAVLAIAILSVILAIFIPRPWCRFVCPTGQILNWTNKLK